MNILPQEVKMFVRTCDITKQQYNQYTVLIGSSDSLLGFRCTQANLNALSILSFDGGYAFSNEDVEAFDAESSYK